MPCVSQNAAAFHPAKPYPQAPDGAVWHHTHLELHATRHHGVEQQCLRPRPSPLQVSEIRSDEMAGAPHTTGCAACCRGAGITRNHELRGIQPNGCPAGIPCLVPAAPAAPAAPLQTGCSALALPNAALICFCPAGNCCRSDQDDNGSAPGATWAPCCARQAGRLCLVPGGAPLPVALRPTANPLLQAPSGSGSGLIVTPQQFLSSPHIVERNRRAGLGELALLRGSA